MDANAIDNALAECLTLIESGEATVADCLERYPQHCNLGPLLRLALGIRQIEHPAPDTGWFARSRHRLEQALEPRSERFVSAVGPAAALIGAWRWSWESSSAPRLPLIVLRVVAVFSMLLVLAVNAVTAAEASLPGSPLYPLKLAAEEARIAATFEPSSRALLHLRVAEQRLDELARANSIANAASTIGLAAAAQTELRAALDDQERAPIGQRNVIDSRLRSLAARIVSLRGAVKAASSEMLRVQGVSVFLTPETVFTGEPDAGSNVAITASLDVDGAFRAAAVAVIGENEVDGYHSAISYQQGSPALPIGGSAGSYAVVN